MDPKDIQLISKIYPEWKPGNIDIKKAGGQTNRNWIVKHKGKKFFVRLPWQMAEIVDRDIESKNILALTENGKACCITPKVHLYIMKGRNILENSSEKYDLPDGTMVADYIEGKDIDGKDLERPRIQDALVETLHNFHSSGVRFVNDYDVFRDEVGKYREKALTYPVSKLISKEKINRIKEIEEQARDNLEIKGEVSTHNDLIFENLRLSEEGKVFLLDFEYAGFNLRDGLVYDLGIIFGGNLFQSNPISLESYKQILNKASSVYGKEFSLQEVLYGALTNILVMFWWGIVKYFNSEEDKDYFKKYVLVRGDKILELSDFIKKGGVN